MATATPTYRESSRAVSCVSTMSAASTASICRSCSCSRGDPQDVLLLALELGEKRWSLGFATPGSSRLRQVKITGRDTVALLAQIDRLRAQWGLPADAPVFSCYEAGREGFWLHHYLVDRGVMNLVVDSASIQVDRRARRAKSDRLDLKRLMGMLRRHHGGERGVWSVVHVPSPEAEDERHPQRHLESLKKQATRITNRIKGLLAGQGLNLTVNGGLLDRLDQLTRADGRPLGQHLRDRLADDLEQWQLIQRQIKRWESRRRERLAARHEREDPIAEQVARLMQLRGIGENSAWLFVTEIFGWREIENRRQLGALCGLTPTPYDSGDSSREQGISRAGNTHVRWMTNQIAWSWLRNQPESKLTHWFGRRFNHGKRQRKRGIVALSRKLLISLWRYLQTGELPPGARRKAEAEAGT